MMNKLYLKSNEGITKTVNVGNGNIVETDQSNEVREKYNGSFHNVEIGVFKKNTLVSGLFCLDGELYVFFNDKYYKESELKYSRYFIFTRIKKFKAFFKGKCIRNFNYIFRYFDDDLYCDDFFYNLVEIKKNKQGQKKYLTDLWCE